MSSQSVQCFKGQLGCCSDIDILHIVDISNQLTLSHPRHILHCICLNYIVSSICYFEHNYFYFCNGDVIVELLSYIGLLQRGGLVFTIINIALFLFTAFLWLLLSLLCMVLV